MRRNFRIGPGAASLMLVVVVVAMSLLALLAFIEVHGDHKLTDRSIDFTVAEYEASAAAEYALAELVGIFAECAADTADDAAYLDAIEARLPDGMTLDGRMVNWEQSTPEGRTLMCSVEIMPLGSDVRYEWRMHIFASEW